MVILVTGRAGAGKSTYATRLVSELSEERVRAIILDSEELRRGSGNEDYSDEGRKTHLERVARMAATMERTGGLVIVAAISPTRELRDMMRSFWHHSRLVYIPGGSLWPGTAYERPTDDEF